MKAAVELYSAAAMYIKNNFSCAAALKNKPPELMSPGACFTC